MRDLDDIDAELRLLSVVRSAIQEGGGEPSTAVIDCLLDERHQVTAAGPASVLQSGLIAGP